ncbi:hypothetical protein [Elioraea sp.]|uniref:hypothetical protein n=1 Tax=Elioraea sp. TaxID=2185103 RepID=UPI0025C5A72F|nr:hypothetical protein [Elioraea sp.]
MMWQLLHILLLGCVLPVAVGTVSRPASAAPVLLGSLLEDPAAYLEASGVRLLNWQLIENTSVGVGAAELYHVEVAMSGVATAGVAVTYSPDASNWEFVPTVSTSQPALRTVQLNRLTRFSYLMAVTDDAVIDGLQANVVRAEAYFLQPPVIVTSRPEFLTFITVSTQITDYAGEPIDVGSIFREGAPNDQARYATSAHVPNLRFFTVTTTVDVGSSALSYLGTVRSNTIAQISETDFVQKFVLVSEPPAWMLMALPLATLLVIGARSGRRARS